VTLIESYRGSRELFINLTLRELRSKYKRSFLGWTWSLVTPLATMAVYTIVFNLFLRARPSPGVHNLHIFALWLECALLPWMFFSAGMMGSIGSVVGNASLISKTYFDRRLLPAATVGAALVSHLIEMSLLTVILVALGDWEAVAFLPIVIALIAIMALASFGTGLLLSSLNVYFRDIEHFMSILLMVWLYLTPIIYPITAVGRYSTIVKLNPMTEMTNCFRAVLYYGKLPTLLDIGYFTGWSMAMLVIGWVVFNRLQGNFAEEL
jgi:ABC-type polysaccharide/polyol phosphate export permease